MPQNMRIKEENRSGQNDHSTEYAYHDSPLALLTGVQKEHHPNQENQMGLNEG